jgi:L-lactate dehydrogenase complex protein LldF
MCPVSERDGSYAYGSAYPGPMGAVLSSQLTGVEGNAALPYAPSLCKACYDACQAKMAIPSLLVHLRSGHVEQRRRTHRVPLRRCHHEGRGRVVADRRQLLGRPAGRRQGWTLIGRRGKISALPAPFVAWTPPAMRRRRLLTGLIVWRPAVSR